MIDILKQSLGCKSRGCKSKCVCSHWVKVLFLPPKAISLLFCVYSAVDNEHYLNVNLRKPARLLLFFLSDCFDRCGLAGLQIGMFGSFLSVLTWTHSNSNNSSRSVRGESFA